MPTVYRAVRAALATTGMVSATIVASFAFPVAAQAQAQPIPYSQGSAALPRALDRIASHFGIKIDYDPVVLKVSTGRPVRSATTAIDAVRQATVDTGLSIEQREDGGLFVHRAQNSGEDIVVTAVRDEAETNLNVNSAASSTRTGKTLREQPRSTTVVSSKLIADQQVQTIQESLRNASGTTAFAATQGPPLFTVRGFVSNALTNGLAGSPGGAQPVAGLERVEVLKGPDAVLAGANSLGGIVNIVTKRPFAAPLLSVALEYGSFDDKKITIDANNALDEDRKFSARIIGEAAKAERTYQGYKGREEYLFAPSLRYKTSTSDFVVGVSASKQFIPIASTTSIDRNFTDTNTFNPQLRIPLGDRDQGVRLGTTREYFDFTQKVTDWLTLVARGEHAFTTQTLRLYLPAIPFGPAADGQYLYIPSVNEDRTRSDAVDGYARLNFRTGPIAHTVSVGANYSNLPTTRYDPLGSDPILLFNQTTGAASLFPTGEPVSTFAPLEYASVESFTSTARQEGYYIQDFMEFGPLHVVAAVRQNYYLAKFAFASADRKQFDSQQRYRSTLPSFGIVYDITKDVSLYANYQTGYQPGGTNFNTDPTTVPGAYTGLLLPDNRTRNIEGGVKVDLFNKRLSIVAAYYQNRQSNLIDTSSVPGVTFLIDGQEGKGIELDINGRILPGWNVAASFSRTKFSYIETSPAAVAVGQQPEVHYSLFTSYEPTAGFLKGFGISGGIYGQSSSNIFRGIVSATGPSAFDNGADGAALRYATFRPFVPASRQVDANLYYSIGGARLNIGVKNLFDRRNYTASPTIDFIPLAEPRTYRATLTYNFF